MDQPSSEAFRFASQPTRQSETLPGRSRPFAAGALGRFCKNPSALAAALVGELSPLWTLAMPLTAPIAYLLTVWIARAAAKPRKKS